MTTRSTPTPRLQVRSLTEVTRVFNARHGTHLSPARVYQILKSAEAKLAAALSTERP